MLTTCSCYSTERCVYVGQLLHVSTIQQEGFFQMDSQLLDEGLLVHLTGNWIARNRSLVQSSYNASHRQQQTTTGGSSVIIRVVSPRKHYRHHHLQHLALLNLQLQEQTFQHNAVLSVSSIQTFHTTASSSSLPPLITHH